MSTIDAEQMSDPAPHCFCKCVESFASGRQIERHIELVAAIPITVDIVTADDVNLGFRGMPSMETSGVTGAVLTPRLFPRRPQSRTHRAR